VIESFRNDLWAGYKDGSGIDRDLRAQFPVVEDALRAAGFPVWAMVEQEADDALAAGAVVAAADDDVERVVICTPDKDLGQCVGGKVWQWDRRQDKWFDADGVRERLGVLPPLVPDLLALVGDAADGFPGLPGWGAKSAAAVLDRWGHLEDIPLDPLTWDAGVRSAAKLNATLREQFELALLFRRIATVETDADVGAVHEWEWTGPTDELPAVVASLGDDRLLERATRLVERGR
jgi:5'-3' exonuclease